MLLISNLNSKICFMYITMLVIKYDSTFCRIFSKVKKNNIGWNHLCKKIDFMTLVKFSFQTLKFVTNIKADNSIMCLWFQITYYSAGQKKITAYGELCDSHELYEVGLFLWPSTYYAVLNQ